jgi:hypothetical protein
MEEEIEKNDTLDLFDAYELCFLILESEASKENFMLLNSLK